MSIGSAAHWAALGSSWHLSLRESSLRVSNVHGCSAQAIPRNHAGVERLLEHGAGLWLDPGVTRASTQQRVQPPRLGLSDSCRVACFVHIQLGVAPLQPHAHAIAVRRFVRPPQRVPGAFRQLLPMASTWRGGRLRPGQANEGRRLQNWRRGVPLSRFAHKHAH